MKNCIYVAATNQHIGKTTTTLGLVAALLNRGINVGYAKPVGQQHVDWKGERVDKDVALFAETFGMDIEPKVHSPVVLGSGYTTQYIDSPERNLLYDKVTYSANILAEQHDAVIHEGTGHPGVGGIVECSNADVAKHLNAGVILVAPGGIGSTYDRLLLCKSVFDNVNMPIKGVIINKILPEKMDKVKYYLSKRLAQDGIDILGFMPFEPSLAYPMMTTVVKAVKGEVLCNEEYLGNLVQDTIAGSLIDLEQINNDQQLLLVVSSRRLNDALKKLLKLCKERNTKPNLAGVIITGHGKLSDESLAFFRESKTPLTRTMYDTYESIIKLSRLPVKLNSKAPGKIEKAIKMVETHVDLDKICKLLGVS